MGANSAANIGKYLGLALMLPIASGVGYSLGYGIDSFFHTHWIRWPFLVLGFIAGIFDLIYELDQDKS